MMPTTVEAIYEHGVLRLRRPIGLAEGTCVDIVVIPREPAPTPGKRSPAQTAAEIAALPMQSSPDGFSGEDHDRVLYGESGT